MAPLVILLLYLASPGGEDLAGDLAGLPPLSDVKKLPPNDDCMYLRRWMSASVIELRERWAAHPATGVPGAFETAILASLHARGAAAYAGMEAKAPTLSPLARRMALGRARYYLGEQAYREARWAPPAYLRPFLANDPGASNLFFGRTEP
jgi:hypothetical protein